MAIIAHVPHIFYIYYPYYAIIVQGIMAYTNLKILLKLIKHYTINIQLDIIDKGHTPGILSLSLKCALFFVFTLAIACLKISNFWSFYPYQD